MITRPLPGAHDLSSGVPSVWWIAVLRLVGLLFAAGLSASRLGLVVHELVGHGGFALVQGGEVTDLRLFWFAGGWISYSLDEPSAAGMLLASIGGLIVEVSLGGALWIGLARADRRATEAGRTRLGIRILRGIGAAIFAHAWWYFATGTWHGFGDGLPTYRALGDARYPVAIAAGLVTCAIAYSCARLVLGAFAAVVPGSRRARIAGVAIAMVTAAVLGATPVAIELSVRSDTRYGAIMKREGDRLAERELVAWQREMQRRGTAVDQAVRDAEARRLAASHREPPFLPVLALLVAAAVAIGAWRARGAPGAIVTRSQLVIAAIVGAGSLAAVIAIDVFFH